MKSVIVPSVQSPPSMLKLHDFCNRAGNLSVLDSKYKSFPNASFTTPNPAGGNIVFNADASGNDMIRTPPATVTVSADYEYPVSFGSLGINASYYYNDGFYWDPDNRVRQDHYNLVNAQLSWKSSNERFRANVFVRNLTKAKYFNQVTTSNLGDLTSPGAPRTFGMTLGVKLGG